MKYTANPTLADTVSSLELYKSTRNRRLVDLIAEIDYRRSHKLNTNYLIAEVLKRTKQLHMYASFLDDHDNIRVIFPISDNAARMFIRSLWKEAFIKELSRIREFPWTFRQFALAFSDRHFIVVDLDHKSELEKIVRG